MQGKRLEGDSVPHNGVQHPQAGIPLQKESKRIAVVIPCNQSFILKEPAKYVNKIVSQGWRDGYEVEVFYGEKYTPAECHDDGIEQGRAWGADAFLIIGTDEVHPINIISHFDSLPSDITVPVIFQRQPPHNTVLYNAAQMEDDGKVFSAMAALEELPENLDDPILWDKFHAAGSGGMFVRRKVFDAIKPPWFVDIVRMNLKYPMTERMIGHDIAFCLKARNAGFKINCDTRARSGHISLFVVDENFRNRMNGGRLAFVDGERRIIHTCPKGAMAPKVEV